MLKKRREKERREKTERKQWRWETENMYIVRENKPTGFILYYYGNETGAQQTSVHPIIQISRVQILMLSLMPKRAKLDCALREGGK